VEPTVSS